MRIFAKVLNMTNVTIKDIKDNIKSGLNTPNLYRSKYGLAHSNTRFFQPFQSVSDAQQQLKTTLITPIVGLFSAARYALSAIKGILIMVASIPCLSPDLLNEGFIDAIGGIVTAVVIPIMTLATTLASLISLVTRSIVTLKSCICVDEIPLIKDDSTFVSERYW